MGILWILEFHCIKWTSFLITTWIIFTAEKEYWLIIVLKRTLLLQITQRFLLARDSNHLFVFKMLRNWKPVVSEGWQDNLESQPTWSENRRSDEAHSLSCGKSCACLLAYLLTCLDHINCFRIILTFFYFFPSVNVRKLNEIIWDILMKMHEINIYDIVNLIWYVWIFE